jgi:hypothetical protein
MSPKEIIVKTKQAILDRGWVKGDQSPEGVCLLRAIEIGAGCSYRSFPNSPDAQMAYMSVVQATGARKGAISCWNDAPGRTRDEVLAVLDAAMGSLHP